MGVPAFFRWLTEKYPKVMEDVLEERCELASAGFGSNNVAASIDCSKPNPSGLETDNLYIDMNGIIHPCSHPEVGPQPKTEEEMYANVGRYIDRLVYAVRPRRLLYLAIDGVAPRAKMNQQRSRRFRSAQEARENQALTDDIQQTLIREGCQFDETTLKKKKASDAWDSNVITPGTPFMLKLSQYVRYYIRQKQSSNQDYWKDLVIIFSDASIPGEGEHKIMSHIRHQRNQVDTYNPNLVHCLHGLDADLIMLALATHEAHFYILREEVMFGRKGQEQSDARKEASGFANAQKLLDEAVGSEAMTTLLENQYAKSLQRLSIPILRDYFSSEFRHLLSIPTHSPHSTSLEEQKQMCSQRLERIIDDIVFLCFFVGNDFLPHLPSLDIRDGALDYLFNVYKSILPTLGNNEFLTSPGGIVHLSHVDVLLSHVAQIENHVFTMKYEQEQKQKQYHAQRKANEKANLTKDKKGPKASYFETETPNIKQRLGKAGKLLQNTATTTTVPINHTTTNNNNNNNDTSEYQPLGRNNKSKLSPKQQFQQKVKLMSNQKQSIQLIQISSSKEENDNSKKRKSTDCDSNDERKKTTKKKKKKQNKASTNKVDDDEDLFCSDDSDDIPTTSSSSNNPNEKSAEDLLKQKVKEATQKKLEHLANTVQDKVRLHEDGWKNRYYSDKCKADDVANHGGREHLFRSYIKGLCWVMKYYYEGCPSWKWYYPFHYGPFASDLKNIERFEKYCAFDKDDHDDQPFRPIEQLMAVLPEDSSHAIPQSSRWLMSDAESPIIDFYPKDVPTDPNGKAMPWLWVVLLPFIDEDRLLSALKPTMEKWSPQEQLCNARGLDDGYIYVHSSHPLAKQYALLLSQKTNQSKDQPKKNNDDKQKKTLTSIVLSTSNQANGDGSKKMLNGRVRLPLSDEWHEVHASVQPTLKSLDPIDVNQSVCLAFAEPAISETHQSKLLAGVILPPSILTDDDRRIRRPRLNRGGSSIAHLGMIGNKSRHHSNNNVNVYAYEQNLITSRQNNDRSNNRGQLQSPWGGQLQQHHHPPPNYSVPPPNIFQPHIMNNNNRHLPPHPTSYGVPPPPPPRQPPLPHQRWQMPPPPSHNYQQLQLPQPQRNNNNNNNKNANNSMMKSNFSFNRQGQQRLQQNSASSSRVNPKLMQSLRSQLASTLNQKKNRPHGK